METTEYYHHTQVGWLMLASAAALVVPAGVPLVLLRWPDSVAYVCILLGAAAVLVLLFGWLTVVVRTGEVEIRPGVGFIRKRYRLSQFVEVRAVRNRWWYGWGLRWWPGTIVYTVSGLDAVDLRRLDGTSLRIGTDEPEALKEALQAAWREAGPAKED